MFRFLAPCALAALTGGTALADTPATCDTSSGRCTVGTTMKTDDGKLFGTVMIEVDKDGADPVLVALTPLGIALRPGVRIVADGAAEFPLVADACLPDGCRASATLSTEQLATLDAAKSLSLQFFVPGQDQPLAGDVPNPDLIAALKSAGAALP